MWECVTFTRQWKGGDFQRPGGALSEESDAGVGEGRLATKKDVGH